MDEQTIAIPEINRELMSKYFWWSIFWSSIPSWLAIFGFPFTIFWLLGFGAYYCKRRASEVHYELTDHKLIVKDGVYLKKEHTIPLDKITDLKISQGILERRFGMWRINVQTAGAGAPVAEATIYALKEPKKFKETVLQARDALVLKSKTMPEEKPTLIESSISGNTTEQLLKEIRDILINIELNTSR